MRVKGYSQLLILFLLVLLSLWKIVGISDEKPEKSHNISIIIRGKMDDGWSNLKKGAESAAEDLNVNLRFVAAIDGNTAEEQIELLRQEAEGTDAILISPVSRTLLKDPILQTVKKNIPVVLIESGLSEMEKLPIIQCNNEEMGRNLAQTVINHGNRKKKILVVSGNAICTSVIDRQKGFMEVMSETENECMILNNGSFSADDLEKRIKEEKPDVAVALDTKVLESLTKAAKTVKKENGNSMMQIYGAGCSSEILNHLENREIVSIAAQDDFSIGYLGVREAVAAIEGKKAVSNKEIRYILTNATHMYDDKNQRLLFPFVK